MLALFEAHASRNYFVSACVSDCFAACMCSSKQILACFPMLFIGKYWISYTFPVHCGLTPHHYTCRSNSSLVVLTRRNISFFSVRSRKAICRHGFATAAPVEWNRLPLNVRSQRTISIFRSQLKTYLSRLAYPPQYSSSASGCLLGYDFAGFKNSLFSDSHTFINFAQYKCFYYHYKILNFSPGFFFLF